MISLLMSYGCVGPEPSPVGTPWDPLVRDDGQVVLGESAMQGVGTTLTYGRIRSDAVELLALGALPSLGADVRVQDLGFAITVDGIPGTPVHAPMGRLGVVVGTPLSGRELRAWPYGPEQASPLPQLVDALGILDGATVDRPHALVAQIGGRLVWFEDPDLPGTAIFGDGTTPRNAHGSMVGHPELGVATAFVEGSGASERQGTAVVGLDGTSRGLWNPSSTQGSYPTAAGELDDAPGVDLVVFENVSGTTYRTRTAIYTDARPGSGSPDGPTIVIQTPEGAGPRDLGRAATIGDFDGDGHPDLALGFPEFGVARGQGDVEQGAILIFRGPLAPGEYTPADADMLFRLSVQTFRLGTVLATADTDGDGVWELAVGNPQAFDDNRGLLAVFDDPLGPWLDANELR
ncbi:MAG: FG-GAP repeat protein [Alphaproteobacteria bacterium]|nr:FG-GAP repeat protein [Alphaproteobacteria bacterium]